MKRILPFIVVFLTGFTAQAQTEIKTEIEDLLADIRSELRVSRASRQELASVRDQLQRAYLLLRDGTPQRPVPSNGVLTCVARDNDGAEPFNVAFRGGDFAITKIPGAVLRKVQCEQSLRNVVQTQSVSFVCGSRDGDGAGPFMIFAFNERTRGTQRLSVYRTLEDCFASVKAIKQTRTHAAFCGSRDGDGMSPFITFVYSFQDQSVRRGEMSFRTMDECLRGSR